MAAMMAVYSIAENKVALCERHGVEYDPADWPAHGILPAEFTTDKGSEWTGRMSDDFVTRTGCTLKTLPTARADWKPTVENGHRLVQDFLRTVEPSFDPDSNSMSRQNMNYGKNACCTLAELNTFVLRCIIDYNKRVRRGHRETLEQLTSDFAATRVARPSRATGQQMFGSTWSR
jgi:putative transposase